MKRQKVKKINGNWSESGIKSCGLWSSSGNLSYLWMRGRFVSGSGDKTSFESRTGTCNNFMIGIYSGSSSGVKSRYNSHSGK